MHVLLQTLSSLCSSESLLTRGTVIAEHKVPVFVVHNVCIEVTCVIYDVSLIAFNYHIFPRIS